MTAARCTCARVFVCVCFTSVSAILAPIQRISKRIKQDGGEVS